MRKKHYKMTHTWPFCHSGCHCLWSRTTGPRHYSQLSFQYFHLPSEVMVVLGNHTAKLQNWNLCLTPKPELFPESRVTANEAQQGQQGQQGLAHHLLTTPLVCQPAFHP